MKKVLFIAFVLLLPLGEAGRGHAQSDWQQYYQMIADENDDDNDDDDNLEQIYEALSEAASSPINLNAITREELEDLMCFSEMQIDAVLEYVNHYAPLRTKAELQMIPFLDEARRGLLSCLTYLGECPPKQRAEFDSIRYENAVSTYRRYYQQEGKGDITVFARVPLYSRKGDGDAYQGGKIKNWLRANYVVNRNVKVGFVAAQDAGEPFFKGKNKLGYDF